MNTKKLREKMVDARVGYPEETVQFGLPIDRVRIAGKGLPWKDQNTFFNAYFLVTDQSIIFCTEASFFGKKFYRVPLGEIRSFTSHTKKDTSPLPAIIS